MSMAVEIYVLAAAYLFFRRTTRLTPATHSSQPPDEAVRIEESARLGDGFALNAPKALYYVTLHAGDAGHLGSGRLLVFEYDPGWVAQSDAVRRNIVYYNAVNSDRSAFANSHAFHDETVLADPGLLANANRFNLLPRRRCIRCNSIFPRCAGWASRIHENAARRNLHIVFDHDFLVDHKTDLMTDIHPVADGQLWFVE